MIEPAKQRTRTALIIVVLATIVIAGCGSDSGGVDAASSTAKPTTTSTSAIVVEADLQADKSSDSTGDTAPAQLATVETIYDDPEPDNISPVDPAVVDESASVDDLAEADYNPSPRHADEPIDEATADSALRDLLATDPAIELSDDDLAACAHVELLLIGLDAEDDELIDQSLGRIEAVRAQADRDLLDGLGRSTSELEGDEGRQAILAVLKQCGDGGYSF